MGKIRLGYLLLLYIFLKLDMGIRTLYFMMELGVKLPLDYVCNHYVLLLIVRFFFNLIVFLIGFRDFM